MQRRVCDPVIPCECDTAEEHRQKDRK